MNLEYRAAIIAIGTELTDGQVIDRNSAWISKKLTEAGLQVIEHRSVPDDRREISLAFGEMSRKVSHLFITGGLGPTSDDFTRDVVATHFGKPLKFDEASWQRIVDRFKARGAEARPIQRQQCYFPAGAEILENPAGTANAFRFRVARHGQPTLNVYVMPGPPSEIDAIWKLHYEESMNKIVPEYDREELYSFKTLGRGESEIAEVVEKEVEGKGLRVGYRASLPYVEVKLWYKRSAASRMSSVTAAIEEKLSSSLATKGNEDLADAVLETISSGTKVSVNDRVTRGEFTSRLRDRFAPDKSYAFSVISDWSDSTEPLSAGDGVVVALESQPTKDGWLLRVKNAHGKTWDLAVPETSIYKFGTERGRKYFTERVFQLLKTEVLPHLNASK